MAKGRPDNRYRSVLDTLIYQISNGELCSGEMLYSRKEICERFGISLVTAFKVQDELQKRGLVTRLPGRGLFINSIRNLAEHAGAGTDLRKVRIIGAENAIGPKTIFGNRLIQGIAAGCREKSLEFRIEYIDNSKMNTEILNNQHNIEPDEGLVVLLHTGLIHEVMIPLLSYQIRSVIVNGLFPWRPSVLTDNYDGITALLNYVQSRGCKRVIYAGRFAQSQSCINETERYEIFLREAPKLGMKIQTEISGNFYELLAKTKEMCADAVMFSGDLPALKFKHLFTKELSRPVIVTGFDDIAPDESGLEHLTTYRIDCEEMGRGAVEQLFSFRHEFQSPMVYRVKGKLIDRR